MKKKERKNKRRSSHGVITVFVTLMMVPVVAITGIMVDVTRLKMYSSQAAMAADSYGDAVLSEFDNLLKQLYGLFSLTQNKEGLEAVEKLADYASYSFNPDKDESGFTGFMHYKDADMEVVYEKIPGASLSNNNVLMTQISDFMRYRIVEQIVDELGILDSLEKFDSMAPDTEAMEERSDLTDSSKKALEKIGEYYQALNKIAKYPDYLDGRAKAYENYSKELKNIVCGDGYEDYVFYLEYEDEIEAIIEAMEAEEDEDEDDDDSDGDDSEDDEIEGIVVDGVTYSAEDLYDKYSDYDADEYKKDLQKKLSDLSKAVRNHDSDPIDFDNADDIIQTLVKKAEEVDSVMETIEEQVARLEEKLAQCSEEVRTGIEEDIKDLKTLLDFRAMFKKTSQWIAVTKDCPGLNSGNKELMEQGAEKLDKIKDDILSGDQAPEKERDKCSWGDEIPVSWADFRDDREMKEFYNGLGQLCGSDGSDKKAGDEETKKANDAQEKAEKELEGDEKTNARDISSTLASQLGSGGGAAGKTPSLTDYFAGGLSFKALASAGSHILDKFLLTSYDFGMFSSRVTGIEPKETSPIPSPGASPDKPGAKGVSLDKPETSKDDSEGGDSKPGGSGGSYTEYSLTKIEMSPDVNYLYGAELEYLFGGHNKSVSNLNETRNIICGVRLTFNFASTYTITEVNNAINAIATGAAAAAGPAAPLVKVAVSGALRMAVSAIETAADWTALKNREDVILIKMDVKDLQSIDALKGLLGDKFKTTASESGKLKFKMSYEDYMYILLCLLVDDNTLLSRTANLITLNVNQAVNDGDTLTNLDFKMADTVTAIKSTCKVKADFVIVPENIAHLYYSNTKTESIIEALEDRYFGYSVIRGY